MPRCGRSATSSSRGHRRRSPTPRAGCALSASRRSSCRRRRSDHLRRRAHPYPAPMNGILRRGALVALAAVTAVVILPAAGAGADEYGNGKVVTVRMIDNAFVPQTLVIDPGTIVRWVNDGRSKHNVVVDAKGPGWSASANVKAGTSYSHEFETPGVYGYSCTLHGAPRRQMYGTVIVRTDDGTVPTGIQ